jgi:hypothetical protein
MQLTAELTVSPRLSLKRNICFIYVFSSYAMLCLGETGWDRLLKFDYYEYIMGYIENDSILIVQNIC